MQIRASLNFLLVTLQAVVIMAPGRRQLALQHLRRILLLQPDDMYSLSSQAHLQAEQIHFEAAIASLQQLTHAWPHDASAWFNLGQVLHKIGRHEDAESAFRNAQECDPQVERAWHGLALALIHRQQFGEAAKVLKKNIALQPMSPSGWYRLVEGWLVLEQPSAAQKLLRHLRQFEPAIASQLEHHYRVFLRDPKGA